MEIRLMKVSDLVGADYNPRQDLKPGDAAYESLDRSMSEYGCVEVPVWNQRTNTLVSGHQRVKVLKAKGITEVQVSVVDLPLEKEKALNIALNKIRGDWDDAKLATLLQQLNEQTGFDVSLTGFDQIEISSLFDKYLPVENKDANSEPEDNSEISITKKGDLICLGKNRLFCGDSTSMDDLKKLIGDEKIQLVHADPPYNVDYDAANRPGEGGSSNWNPIANDSLPQKDYESWLRKVIESIKPFLDKGAPMYLWNGHRQFGPMHSMLTELGFHVSNVIVWAKPFPTPGYGDYQMACEFCLYSWLNDNGAHRWYGKIESNVWESSRDSAGDLIHPSQKPIELARRAIQNSSLRGDIVLDMMAGSGSTLIGSKSLDRICYSMEIEPSYVDAIVRRYIHTFGANSVSEEVRTKYKG